MQQLESCSFNSSNVCRYKVQPLCCKNRFEAANVHFSTTTLYLRLQNQEAVSSLRLRVEFAAVKVQIWSFAATRYFCSLKFWYCISFLQLEAVILHVSFAAWSFDIAFHFCSLKLWYCMSLLQLEAVILHATFAAWSFDSAYHFCSCKTCCKFASKLAV